MHQNAFPQNLEEKFHNVFRWNFFGSIIYECIKTIHQISLMFYLSSSLYGLIGTTFSIIYFSTKLADTGATYTLSPFFTLITKNRKNFKYFYLNYFIGPMIPAILMVSFGATHIFLQWFLPSSYCLYYVMIIPMLIALETLRAFLRYLLHFSFKSKMVVSIELFSFSIYVISIWTGFLLGNWEITLDLMLIAHLVESSLAVLIFIILSYHVYQNLDPHALQDIPTNTASRFWHARIFNYLLRLSRELFSSNFITPLFAFKFGFYETGLFYFVGAVMSSLQSITKISIGYSGNALLAEIKNESEVTKQKAFLVLSEKIIKIIIPIVILLGINGNSLIRLYQGKNNLETTLLLVAIFLIIFISEFFVILYDQFYIVEEASQKLFFMKISEYVFYYIFVISIPAESLVELLLRITFIRIASLSFMAYNAHYTWKIKPSFKTKKSYLVSCFIIGIIIFFTVSRYFNSIFYFSQHLL